MYLSENEPLENVWKEKESPLHVKKSEPLGFLFYLMSELVMVVGARATVI